MINSIYFCLLWLCLLIAFITKDAFNGSIIQGFIVGVLFITVSVYAPLVLVVVGILYMFWLFRPWR